MSDTDIELLKLKIQHEMQREQLRHDLLKWLVVFVWPFVLQLGSAYIESRVTVAAAADVKKVAANKAAELKTELTAAKVETDQAIATVAAGVDASVKGWKAYQTKEPEDMDRAAQAVVNAERLTENMPPVAPKP